MLFEKECGVLLHPTCLPAPYGVGDLGPDAYRFIECLVRAGQVLWQVLPLTPPGNAASPYQCESSFAGDALLISPDRLAEQGLLAAGDKELLARSRMPVGRFDQNAVMATKMPLLRRSAALLLAEVGTERRARYEAYCEQESSWLQDYARFRALKSHHSGAAWFTWPEPIVHRTAEALALVDRDHGAAIAVEKVIQFLFEEQWQQLKAYANERGIRIVGDVPIFVAHDSADTWADQSLFQLDSAGQPTCVAGVPPDYFSEEGQRWGNPLFDWPKHVESNFAWWRARIGRTLKLTDLLRLDHFRGLAACWEIPKEEKTAKVGRWAEAPGQELLQCLEQDLGQPMPIIAEDLGIITDDVVALRERFRLPTMRIMQFSFGSEDEFLPHNYPENCVAYTGTHDNDTTLGWFTEVGPDPKHAEAERDHVRRYYSTDGSDIHWTMIQGLLKCPAAAVVIPLQDVLGLGSEARMNTPGTVGPHNWTWRFQWSQVDPETLDALAELTRASGRSKA